MNSSERGFSQLAYLGSHPPITRVSSWLTPYPYFWFASDERGWEEGKQRQKRGGDRTVITVTPPRSPSGVSVFWGFNLYTN
ncbi:hypothetical protein HanHA300_Chr02g0047681 [Helianthus annuus]|nr:hypothetical protein HanHA300_Chr02g0047681 [Helianthus annuus]